MNQQFFKARYLLPCLCLIYSNLFSQKRFEPALVITSNKDTLIGLVNNKDWLSDIPFITFRDTLTGKEKNYTKSRMESFRFLNGSYFVSRYVSMNYYTEDMDELKKSKDTIVTKDTLMLRVIFKGKASLYSYVDGKGMSHFFIEKEGFKTDELVCKRKIIVNSDGDDYVITLEKYKQSLSYYLNDCPAVISKIASLSFNQKALAKLFENYQMCVAPNDSSFVKKEENTKVEFGLIGGLSIESIYFESSISFDLSNANFPKSSNLFGGAFINLVLPHNYHRMAICNEVLLKNFKTSDTPTQAYYYGPPSTDRNYFFNITYLKIATTFNLDLTNTSFRPYIKLGMVNSFVLGEDSHVPFVYGGGNRPVDSLDYQKHHEEGITFAIGIKNKHYFFEIGYELGNGITDLISLGATSKTYNFLIGYCF